MHRENQLLKEFDELLVRARRAALNFTGADLQGAWGDLERFVADQMPNLGASSLEHVRGQIERQRRLLWFLGQTVGEAIQAAQGREPGRYQSDGTAKDGSGGRMVKGYS